MRAGKEYAQGLTVLQGVGMALTWSALFFLALTVVVGLARLAGWEG